ncbi:MAG: hypothetical protein FD129_331, partial [bacterium]
MSRLSTAVRYIGSGSQEGKKNVQLLDLTSEFKSRDNASFLAEVARQMESISANGGFPAGTTLEPTGLTAIGLMGGYGVVNYFIRQAQHILRVDRTPSNWSHCFLMAGRLSQDERKNRSRAESAWIWESTLEPATPF